MTAADGGADKQTSGPDTMAKHCRPEHSRHTGGRRLSPRVCLLCPFVRRWARHAGPDGGQESMDDQPWRQTGALRM